MPASHLLQRQHLLIDADDTLWENNIYFERAFNDFVDFLDHEHLTASEIQAVLDELEIANRGSHGYGARAFARSLRDTFQHISGVPEGHPDLDTAERLGLRILDQHFEMIEGVLDTLRALRPHHDLHLVTKGHEEEQRAKVDRSGIAHLFDQVVIVAEKHAAMYRELIASLGVPADRTWMIGNSPRSDINPALQAGLNAVFIPHDRTWHLEVEDMADGSAHGSRLVHLERFRDLVTLFHADTQQPGPEES